MAIREVPFDSERELMGIEGVSGTGEIFDLQQAFAEENALQCGFCTPGMLLTVHEILKMDPRASEEAIRQMLSGNYCRTGDHAIVQAARKAGAARSGGTR